MPPQWLKIVSYLRTIVISGPSGISNIFIGINNNFNQICPSCPYPYKPPAGKFDLDAIAALYRAVDFIALSAYAPLTSYPVRVASDAPLVTSSGDHVVPAANLLLGPSRRYRSVGCVWLLLGPLDVPLPCEFVGNGSLCVPA
jgi:hypothetical protein